jgi:hypothetical protein
MNSRPNEVTAGENNGGDGDSGYQPNSDHQDNFGQGIRLVIDGVDDVVLLRVQEGNDDKSDRRKLRQGFEKLDLS